MKYNYNELILIILTGELCSILVNSVLTSYGYVHFSNSIHIAIQVCLLIVLFMWIVHACMVKNYLQGVSFLLVYVVIKLSIIMPLLAFVYFYK